MRDTKEERKGDQKRKQNEGKKNKRNGRVNLKIKSWGNGGGGRTKQCRRNE